VRETYWEDCGQCHGENEDCDLCKGSGRVERCSACHAAISSDDDGLCFYCDVMGEDPEGAAP
jgi:RecJ-like exonuclease